MFILRWEELWSVPRTEHNEVGHEHSIIFQQTVSSITLKIGTEIWIMKKMYCLIAYHLFKKYFCFMNTLFFMSIQFYIIF